MSQHAIKLVAVSDVSNSKLLLNGKTANAKEIIMGTIFGASIQVREMNTGSAWNNAAVFNLEKDELAFLNNSSGPEVHPADYCEYDFMFCENEYLDAGDVIRDVHALNVADLSSAPSTLRYQVLVMAAREFST
jgi:hypothetical protein